VLRKLSLLSLMRGDMSEDAARAVIARTVRLFRIQQARLQELGSILRRIMAALSFDSARLQPLAGLRAGEPDVHQLLYSADEFDLDLGPQPSGPKWMITRQILGPCTGGQSSCTEQRTTCIPISTRSAGLACRWSRRAPISLVLHLPDALVEVSEIAVEDEYGSS